MSTNNVLNLNDEINTFISKMGIPEEVIEIISDSVIKGQEGEVKGLQIGETAPDFTLLDVTGRKISLYKELKKGPVVLSFFRGSWCPFCSIELQALQKNLTKIRAKGANIMSIHPQRIEVSLEVIEKFNLKFPVLSDGDQSVLDSYKIKFRLTDDITTLYKESFGIDLENLNANGIWNLPVPATFIVDSDGIIKGRHFSHDYMIRMEPRDIIFALENLPFLSEEIVYSRYL